MITLCFIFIIIIKIIAMKILKCSNIYQNYPNGMLKILSSIQ